MAYQLLPPDVLRVGFPTLFALREGIVEFTRGLKRRVHVRPLEG